MPPRHFQLQPSHCMPLTVERYTVYCNRAARVLPKTVGCRHDVVAINNGASTDVVPGTIAVIVALERGLWIKYQPTIWRLQYVFYFK